VASEGRCKGRDTPSPRDQFVDQERTPVCLFPGGVCTLNCLHCSDTAAAAGWTTETASVTVGWRRCSIIIRPHRSTAYVDVAYCYGRNGVVCRSVCHSPAKTAGPSEMSCGVWTRVGPGNHVLLGDPDPPCKGEVLRGKDPL